MRVGFGIFKDCGDVGRLKYGARPTPQLAKSGPETSRRAHPWSSFEKVVYWYSFSNPLTSLSPERRRSAQTRTFDL